MHRILFYLLAVALSSQLSFGQTNDSTYLSDQELIQVQEFMLKKLLYSPFNYATQKYTGIIFVYGTVDVNLDKLTPQQVDYVRTAIQLGQFVVNGTTYDIFGVSWRIELGLNYPRFSESFRNKLSVEKWGAKTFFTEEFYEVKRKQFAIIPEIEEKRNSLSTQGAENLIRVITQYPALKNNLSDSSSASCVKIFN